MKTKLLISTIFLLALFACSGYDQKALDKFIEQNDFQMKAARDIDYSNALIYDKIEHAVFDTNNEKINRPYYDKAMMVKKTCDDMQQYIYQIEKELIAVVEETPISDEMPPLKSIKHKDNADDPTHYFLGEGTDAVAGTKAYELKEKIKLFKENIVQISNLGENIKLGLSLEDAQNDDGKVVHWEIANFYKRPVVAVFASLSKLQFEIRETEQTVISALAIRMQM